MSKYTPRRQSKRWLEGAPDGILCVMDNRGKTFDRYTIIFRADAFHVTNDGAIIDGFGEYRNTYLRYIGASERPFDPQGFGQSGEFTAHDCANYRYYRKRDYARWHDLPADVKRYALQFLDSE